MVIANPQEARAKANLAHLIVDIIAGRKLTQVQAGKVLGVDQPQGACLDAGPSHRLFYRAAFALSTLARPGCSHCRHGEAALQP